MAYFATTLIHWTSWSNQNQFILNEDDQKGKGFTGEDMFLLHWRLDLARVKRAWALLFNQIGWGVLTYVRRDTHYLEINDSLTKAWLFMNFNFGDQTDRILFILYIITRLFR